MRSRFDAFGKNVLRDTLARVGAADTGVEVIAASQTMDVWYVPDPARAASLTELGLLGELAADACQFEPFHDTPGPGELRGCVRKQLHWHHELERRAGGEAPFPRLCLLSSGRPGTVLDAFGFGPVPGRPGLYRAAPGWRVDVVVIAELPRTRETLLLRLLGARAVLRDAIRELAALPEDAWERSIALPWLVRLRFETPAEPSARAAEDAEEEEIVTEVQRWFEQLKQSLRDEGLKEGQIQALTRQFEKKLGRPLAEAERSVLAERFDRLGLDRLDDVRLELSADALAAWLADPAAR
ncbi:hypothetical protein SOCE26_064820 [Sorangium cellulosum]|uniref:DUF4351 domain-containing protein n=1 Tax=Sorangium cellulosum TaxID=56 RepID=A0A2L0F0F0_SORCE|nr:hypothetical protein [Sorangium cellulosum]AUX45003.1 hypothetical protein SOCE26_064820 [Sorangium cellulosum]